MADTHILIVEDDLIVARSIQNHLTRLGYKVPAVTAEGENAVRHVTDDTPDLVLMDVKLKGVLDGIQTAEKIQALADIPIVYLTAYADDETLARAKVTGPFGYLLKPFSVKELHSTIEMALYKHQMDQEVAHLNRVLRAIRNVNQLITREKDREQLLAKACQKLTETDGYATAWILYADASQQTILFSHAGLNGPAEAFVEQVHQRIWPACWEQITGSPGEIILQDVQTTCAECLLNAQYSQQKRLSISLEYDKHVYGAMTVTLPTQISISDEETALLREVASDIAYALHSIDQEEKRQRAERQEKATEKKYRNVIESIPMGMHMYRLDSGDRLVFTGANPAADALLGIDNSKFIGKTIEEAFPPLAETEVPERYRAAASDGIAWYTSQITYEDHQIVGAFEVQAFQTSPGNMVAAFWDITERKQAEQALREEHDRAQRYLDVADVMLLALNKHGQITMLNRKGYQLLGYPEGALLGKNWFDICRPPRERENAKADFEQMMAGESRYIEYYENTVLTSSGEERIMIWHNTVLKDEAGNITSTLSSGEDITERKQAEVENLRLASVIEQASETIVITDLSGDIIYANPNFEETTGYTVAEALGQNPRILQSGQQDAAFYKNLWDTLTAGEMWSGTLINKRKDGDLYHESATIFPVRNTVGEIVNYAAVKRDVTEQVRIQEALRESNEFLQNVLQNSPSSIFVRDREGRYIMMNRQYESVIGITSEQAFGKHPKDLHRPLAHAAIVRDDNLVLKDGLSVTTEESVYVEDNMHTFITTKVPLRDASGNPYAICTVATDITDRKLAEMELAKAQALLLAAIENSPAGILIADAPDVRIRIANSAALGIRGTTEKPLTDIPMELHPQYWQIFYPDGTPYKPEDLPLSRAILYGETVSNEEVIIRRQDGEQRWILANAAPVRNAEGEITAGVVVFPDITELKNAEVERERLLAQNQESTQQIRQIVETVPEGVILLDAYLCVVLCNPVATEFISVLTDLTGQCLGNTLTYLGHRPITEFLDPPPNGLWHPLTVEHRHFQIIARAVESGPTIGGWILVIRDVTQEYEIQQQTQRQERLAAIGQLAAGIAHDFNNIISVIVLYSQMSTHIANLPQAVIDRLEIIADQGKQASELINQILDFSRSTTLDQRPLDLLPLLKEQTKLWQRTMPDNIRVDLTYQDETYTVNADPTRIQQVLLNLAVNARDAMPDGGRLHIDMARITVSDHESRPAPNLSPGGWIRITVTDTGTGIAEELVPHIYDPFFTTKAPGQGTGLGLAQVYGIITKHDGIIDVKTQVGHGTSMIVYLPALATPPHPPGAASPQDLPMGMGETILVVEDSAPTRTVIIETLETLNYGVLEAGNGAEALTVFAQHRQEIALVLSDMVMPEMGGINLARELHRQAPAIPVVLMSGHPLNEDISDSHEAGIAEWIQKPPSLAQLADVLSREIKV